MASKAIQICKCLKQKMVGDVEKAKANRRNQTLFSFMVRISSNLYAVGLLSALSSKRDGFLTMKLPVGILLRNCYMDMLYAFYLLSLKDSTMLDEELDILNKDYVKAFCKGGFPVYSDRLQAEGITMEENLLEHLYGLSIEDTFPNSLDWNGLFDTKQYATPLKSNQIRSNKNNENVNIERIYEKISSSDNPYKEITKKYTLITSSFLNMNTIQKVHLVIFLPILAVIMSHIQWPCNA